jgi:uncharacterized phage infection (PIP) family protein YhgE
MDVNKIQSANEELMLENLQLNESIKRLTNNLRKRDYEIEKRGKILIKVNDELNDCEEEISYLCKIHKELKNQFEEIKTLPIEKPAPKKVKLFGITILKIE